MRAKYVDWMAIGWLLVVTWMSLAPLPELPEIREGDKLGHVAAYALLAGLATLHRQRYLAVIAIAAAIVAYGGLIELVQPLVNRHGEFGDFVANGAGVLLGTGTVVSLSRLTAWLRAR